MTRPERVLMPRRTKAPRLFAGKPGRLGLGLALGLVFGAASASTSATSTSATSTSATSTSATSTRLSVQSFRLPLIPLTPKEQTTGPDPAPPAAPASSSQDSAEGSGGAPVQAPAPPEGPAGLAAEAPGQQSAAHEGPLTVDVQLKLTGAAPTSALGALSVELRPGHKTVWSETGARGALKASRPEIRQQQTDSLGSATLELGVPQQWSGLMLPQTSGCQLRSESVGWTALTEWWVSWKAGPQGQWPAGSAQLSAQTSQGRAALLYAQRSGTLDDVLVCPGVQGTQIGVWGQLRAGWNLLVARRATEGDVTVVRVNSLPIQRSTLKLTLTPGSLFDAPTP